MKKQLSTSWGNVARWYDETVEQNGSYQQELILPNLLRLMEIKRGERVLDLACGQGLFSRAFHAAGANVIGADISKELIEIARAKSSSNILNGQAKKKSNDIVYHIAPADALPFLKNGSMNKIALVLALQNIEDINSTLAEVARVLVPRGRLYIVLNHPTFRIPKASSWGFDEEAKTQYRRIDRYLSELKTEINMNPGGSVKRTILSFHRPLQSYAKVLFKHGLSIRRLEEWSSTKKSQAGPRADAEDRARAEIPLFLTIEAQRQPTEHL